MDNKEYDGTRDATGISITLTGVIGEEDVEQGADSVHEKTGCRVDVKEKRNQDRCAKHREQVLQAERNVH